MRTVTYMSATSSHAEWLREDTLAELVEVSNPCGDYVLVFWHDSVTVIEGSVADIRALLVAALEQIPEGD